MPTDSTLPDRIVYIPDSILDNDGFYCTFCGTEGLFSGLHRREPVENVIAELAKHRKCANPNQVAVPYPVDRVGPAGPHGTGTEEATRS